MDKPMDSPDADADAAAAQMVDTMEMEDVQELIARLSKAVKIKEEKKEKEKSKGKGKDKGDDNPLSLGSMIEGLVNYTERQGKVFEAEDRKKTETEDRVKEMQAAEERDLHSFLAHSLLACEYDPEAHGYEGRFIVYKNALSARFPSLCIRSREKKSGSWWYMGAMILIMLAFFIALQSPLVLYGLDPILGKNAAQYVSSRPTAFASLFAVLGLFAFAEAKAPGRGFTMTLQMTPRSHVERLFSIEEANGRFPSVDTVCGQIRDIVQEFRRKAE